MTEQLLKVRHSSHASQSKGKTKASSSSCSYSCSSSFSSSSSSSHGHMQFKGKIEASSSHGPKWKPPPHMSKHGQNGSLLLPQCHLEASSSHRQNGSLLLAWSHAMQGQKKAVSSNGSEWKPPPHTVACYLKVGQVSQGTLV